MAKSYQQEDTAAVCAVGTDANRLAVEGGVAGATAVSISIAAAAAEDAWSFEIAPGSIDWAAGTFTSRINISTGNGNVTLDSIRVYRYTSGCAQAELLGSVTGLADGNSGVRVHNITLSAATSPAGTDRCVVLYRFVNAHQHSAQSLSITPDQVLDAPWSAAGTSVSKATAVPVEWLQPAAAARAVPSESLQAVSVARALPAESLGRVSRALQIPAEWREPVLVVRKLQYRGTPTLDGGSYAIGDGVARLRLLRIPAGEYATPFWLRYDGDSLKVDRVGALPWQTVRRYGKIEVSSTGSFFTAVDNAVHASGLGWAFTAADEAITWRQLGTNISGYSNPEDPGVAFAYNDYAIRLYCESLKRIFDGTNSPPETALDPAAQSRLVTNLGMQDTGIFTVRNGCGVSLSRRDFARIGWWFLNHGLWNGTQLLPAAWFTDWHLNNAEKGAPEGLPVAAAGLDDYLAVGTVGGSNNQDFDGRGRYCFNLWFNALVGGVRTWPDAPTDMYAFHGHNGTPGESMVIYPTQKVVVAAGSSTWGNWSDWGNASGTFNLRCKKIKDACTGAAPASVWPGADWATATDAEAGMDTTLLDELVSELGGAGVVVRSGYLVRSWGTYTDQIDWASAAKPVVSAMLAFAVDEGLI